MWALSNVLRLWNEGPTSISGSLCCSSCKEHFTSSVNLHNEYSQWGDQPWKPFQGQGKGRRQGVLWEGLECIKTMKFAKVLNDHLPLSVKQMCHVPLQPHLMSLLHLQCASGSEHLAGKGSQCGRRWSEWLPEHLCFHDTEMTPYFPTPEAPTQDWGSCFMEPYCFISCCVPSTSPSVWHSFRAHYAFCGKEGWLISPLR